MQRTSEQQELIDSALAAGQRRIVRDFTPEQLAEWRQAVAEEEAAKEETIAGLRRMQAAEAEPGFFGDLRRAVSARLVAAHKQGRPPSTEPLGIDAQRLEAFREGALSLTDDELRRLIDALGLQLVQPIPRPRDRQESPA
jgi:hypothetical protein